MVSDYTGSGGAEMLKMTFALISGVFLVSSSPMPQVSSAVRADLAPTGTLRAGINYGNPILAQGGPAAGDLRGIAVDLARELARRIGVPVALVPYDAAGKMTDAVKTGAWDVAFLAVDPARASEISFTAPYLEIEGTYLVPADSPLRTIEDVDRDGVRVAISAKSAYDLFLSRELKHAHIVRAPSIPASIDLFAADKLEAVAGVRQALVTAAAKIPGSRVLEGRFMVIPQAAGVPTGREAGARYLRQFIEDAKASGLVAQALKKSGVEDSVTIAAPAPVK
jgi:polar amino acid transport system substrate-binding protein